MKLSSILFFFFIFIFSGCSPKYNVEPKYNITNKNIKINNYLIDSEYSFKEEKKYSKHGSKNLFITYITTKAYDSECNFISYSNNVAGKNRFYLSSAIENVLSEYDNDCEVEQIGNINFYRCYNKVNVTNNTDTHNKVNIYYGLTSSQSYEHGIKDKKRIFLYRDMKCYKKIRNHFRDITKPEYINITHNFKK